MEIIVEDHRIDLEVSGKKVQLKNVVDEVEQFLFSAGKIPVGLQIDGHALTQDEYDERFLQDLKGDEVLEFSVITIYDFILTNVEGAEEANVTLAAHLKTFALELHSQEKTVKIEDVREELSNFFDFWLKIQQLLPDAFKELKEQGVDFDQAMRRLKDLFQEIVQAMEGADFVLAADLVQYEIVVAIEALSPFISELKKKILEKKEMSQEAVSH
ncbi:MAG: hypothetical protein K0S07_1203 [Chlamydiales bacterium]|jgi:hypothetical protein|nr:hypothetical protein [Chlamydiales bacterium]